jgi:hypothetical protein
MVETALRSFESPSDSFYLSPNIDKRFRLSRSRDLGIFKVGHHEIEFGTHQEINTLFLDKKEAIL